VDRVPEPLLLNTQAMSANIRHKKAKAKMGIIISELLHNVIKVVVRNVREAMGNVVFIKIVVDCVSVYMCSSCNF